MIQKLNWDSDFFNLNVAKWQLQNDEQPSIEKVNQYLQEFDLIYLASNQPITSIDKTPLDIKTTYTINAALLPESSLEILSKPFDRSIHSKEELLETVLESGKYSRFNLDKRIPNNKFEELYTIWMNNGIEEKQGSKVYVITNSSYKIDGFIQLKIVATEKVSIELIAVATNARGKGVASQLLKDATKITLHNNIPILEVVTQDQNIAATKLYLKNSFRLKKREYIYHLWKR